MDKTEIEIKSMITRSEAIGTSVFSVTYHSMQQTLESYLLYFYTDVLRIGAGLSGTLMLIGQLWDTVNDPLIGYYADNHQFKNGEKVRPYLRVFPVFYAIFCVLMFTAPNFSLPLKFAYALAVKFVFDIFSTIIIMPYSTLRILASPLVSDRLRLNQHFTVGGVIGIGVSAIVFFPLVGMFGGTDSSGKILNESLGFVCALSIFAVLMVGGMYLYYFTARERVKPIVEGSGAQKVSLWASLKELITCKTWDMLIVYRFLFSLCSVTITSCLTYYCKYVLGGQMYVSVVMSAFLVGGIIAVPLSKPIMRKHLTRGVAVAAAATFILGKLVFFIDTGNLIFVMANALITGMGVSFGNVILGVYDAFVADIVEVRFGKRLDNMVFTLGNLFRKGAMALVMFLIGFTLGLAKYDGALDVQPDSAISMIKLMIGVIPLVFSVVYLLMSIKFNPEKEAKELRKGA